MLSLRTNTTPNYALAFSPLLVPSLDPSLLRLPRSFSLIACGPLGHRLSFTLSPLPRQLFGRDAPWYYPSPSTFVDRPSFNPFCFDSSTSLSAIFAAVNFSFLISKIWDPFLTDNSVRHDFSSKILCTLSPPHHLGPRKSAVISISPFYQKVYLKLPFFRFAWWRFPRPPWLLDSFSFSVRIQCLFLFFTLVF